MFRPRYPATFSDNFEYLEFKADSVSGDIKSEAEFLFELMTKSRLHEVWVGESNVKIDYSPESRWKWTITQS